MNYNILNFLKNIKFKDIVSTTNKTLNIVKKSIPVYKEIRPFMTREKSIFKNNNQNINDIKSIENINKKSNTYNDSLTFFQ